MQALQTARILWAALLTSTILFLVVLLFAKPAAPEPPEPIMLPALAFVAVTVAIMSFVMPAMSHKQGVQRFSVPTKSETVTDASRPASDILPASAAATTTRMVPADPALARGRAAALFMTPFILSLALSEAVALFGFVTGFLGFALAYALPFFVVSWILIVLRFPTWERMVGPIERAKGIHIPRA